MWAGAEQGRREGGGLRPGRTWDLGGLVAWAGVRRAEAGGVCRKKGGRKGRRTHPLRVSRLVTTSNCPFNPLCLEKARHTLPNNG